MRQLQGSEPAIWLRKTGSTSFHLSLNLPVRSHMDICIYMFARPFVSGTKLLIDKLLRKADIQAMLAALRALLFVVLHIVRLSARPAPGYLEYARWQRSILFGCSWGCVW